MNCIMKKKSGVPFNNIFSRITNVSSYNDVYPGVNGDVVCRDALHALLY